jgi:large subunit ribosomal protein L24
MHKIKKGDNIMVISGKSRGKVSTVEKVLVREKKVIITGVNICKKHLKPSRKNPHGGILDMAKPIDVSNVMIFCPQCSKPVRISYKITGKSKERVCVKCKGNLDINVVAKTSVKEQNVTTK